MYVDELSFELQSQLNMNQRYIDQTKNSFKMFSW